ncbi:MAG: DUF1292 domain-containing protein [Clostridia bacterium]|nr:DUF1292 domain-containing protein [Clostridia bacterium]
MANNEEVNGCASGCAGCSGCGHDHMELPEDMSPIITLTDEDGKDVKFEILDVVALEDERSFLIVTEVAEEETEGDVEVVILEIKQDGEEEVYDTVTDEELAKEVFDRFTKQQEELDEE